jgi:hypothetical protein
MRNISSAYRKIEQSERRISQSTALAPKIPIQKARAAGADTLHTVRRAATVLDLFLDDTALSLIDVVRATGIGQTVAYRLLQTWVDLDFLYFDRDAHSCQPYQRRYRRTLGRVVRDR